MITAMLQTRGPGVQDNWDLWINVSVFAYNTTVSTSTGVTPHYTILGCEAMLAVDWVFPTPSVEKRTMYQWTGDRLEERQLAYKRMRDVQAGRVQGNAQMYKHLTQNIRVGCLVLLFYSKNHPWNQSQAEIILGGTVLSVKTDSSSLGKDKTSILSLRRKIGESRRVETIPLRRCDLPEP